MNGGRFDFDDGGSYCGGWEEGKAHGHGVCTGPKGQGEYSGAWHYGFEVSGVYIWPSGNTFEGQWQNGKRHGLGIERRGRWIYRGEWTQGFKGRYGIRQSNNSKAKYEGTWAAGLQDGYGTETYADGGTYQGQWLRGMRHGYGVRKSVPYGMAAKFRCRSQAHSSLSSLRSDQGDESIAPGREGSATGAADSRTRIDDQCRGGFVLRARSEPPSRRRSLSERSVAMKRSILQGLRIKKQRSTGDITQRVAASGCGAGETPRSLRSSGSTASCASDESAFTGVSGHGPNGVTNTAPEEPIDSNVVETYSGEWKNDKRSGCGVSERSDGLKYEGEWFNNRKYGYGVTTLKDGTREEGKYKNNILVTSQRKKHLLFVRSSKLRERIDSAVAAAHRASQLAVQKSDIAESRTATARDRGAQADMAAGQAREDSELARVHAKQYSPEFRSQGLDYLRKRDDYSMSMGNHVTPGSPNMPRSSAHSNHVRSLPSRSRNALNPSLSPPLSSPLMSNSTSYTSSSGDTPLETPLMEPMDFKATTQMKMANDIHFSTNHDDPYASNVGVRSNHHYEDHNDRRKPPPHTSLASYSPQQQQYNMPKQQYSSAVMSNSYAEDALLERLSHPVEHTDMISPQALNIVNPHPPVLISEQPPSLPHNAKAQQPYKLPAAEEMRPSTQHKAAPPSGHFEQLHHQQQQQQPLLLNQRVAQLQGQQQHQQQHHNYPPPSSLNISDRKYTTANDDSRASSESAHSSAYSLNQIVSDHYDQYAARYAPTPQRSANNHRDAYTPNYDADSDTGVLEASVLHRRSTLASSRDRVGMHYQDSNPPIGSTSPTKALHNDGSSRTGAGRHLAFANVTPASAAAAASTSQGSVPDLTSLEKSPLHMTREEIARMSSQRRQELHRMREEEELLKSNPLRYVMHPAVREWISRQRFPLILLIVNLTLGLTFWYLLTYTNAKDKKSNDDHSS